MLFDGRQWIGFLMAVAFLMAVTFLMAVSGFLF